MSVRRKSQQSSKVARSSSLAFDSILRGRIEPEQFTASQAKNEFARALDGAMTHGAVVITKHDSPKAVLLSVEEFKELTRDREQRMNALRAEYDEMYARMQQPSF